MEDMMKHYDFIVVGGESNISPKFQIGRSIDTCSAGASGCVVASRLANTKAKPSVLLVEAGGTYQSAADLSGEERYKLAFNPGSPFNWHYKTVPQRQLSGQCVDYSRGKGLGGSTAINFCAWTVGSKDDFDEYAALIEDGQFGWENVQNCLRRIERVHHPTSDEKRQHADPKPGGEYFYQISSPQTFLH